jgi:hypothetical protein
MVLLRIFYLILRKYFVYTFDSSCKYANFSSAASPNHSRLSIFRINVLRLLVPQRQAFGMHKQYGGNGFSEGSMTKWHNRRNEYEISSINLGLKILFEAKGIR